jgi:glycyl-tRNA synthetase
MEKNKEKLSIEEMANFCKKKGFITQSGEIYGGFAGFWDYLFLGSELKRNIEDTW